MTTVDLANEQRDGAQTGDALIPGAAIGGYLGVQSGEAGGDAGASTPAWSRWHHHYNDLGTVIATTDEDGAKIGVYTPDFWGNYHAGVETQSQLAALYESLDADDETIADLLRANGFNFDIDPKPDTMGLTSKFYDDDAELHYFSARWYDSERGRWMSRDPIGVAGGINLYSFAGNRPLFYVDPTGEAPQSGGQPALMREFCTDLCMKSFDLATRKVKIPKSVCDKMPGPISKGLCGWVVNKANDILGDYIGDKVEDACDCLCQTILEDMGWLPLFDNIKASNECTMCIQKHGEGDLGVCMPICKLSGRPMEP